MNYIKERGIRMPERRQYSPKSAPRRTAAPAGSRSPKHRGYRADSEQAAPAKKARWTPEQREVRGLNADRPRGGADRRDERPAGRGYGQAAERGGRFERSSTERGSFRGAPARGERGDSRDRGPARESGRRDWYPDGYRGQAAGGSRNQRGRGDDRRPAAGLDRDRRWEQRDERAPRGDRFDRPARDDRGPRQDRFARPARDDRFDRGPRQDRFDRPARDDRFDRGPRQDRFDRPARDDRFDRGPRQDRFERPAREDRFDRAPRRFEERAPRRYEEPKQIPFVEDVVLERLEAQAVTASEVSEASFADLGLGKNIVAELAELGAERPFPIQAATIPEVLAGRDVLGRGRTGSGKTIAFGAPLVERLMAEGNGKRREHGRAPRAMILAPTRELALQIDATVQPIARSVGLFTTQIYGGVPQGRQVGALQRGVDIIIGTPGRIEDLVRQGKLDLSRIEISVLDEADHMCDLGFLEPVQRILEQTRDGGQRLLFSATLDKGVAVLVEKFLKNPAVYEVAGEDQASATIDHRVFVVEQSEKVAIIEELASRDGKSLVFARTRAFAEQLTDHLDDMDIRAVSLHGDLNQARRTRNLEKLTSGRARVLVATDVAARGIHVDDIELVVQADIPEEYKTYLHRAGRTGRAGKEGTVITLVTRNRLRKLMELLGRAEIEVEPEHVRAGQLPAIG